MKDTLILLCGLSMTAFSVWSSDLGSNELRGESGFTWKAGTHYQRLNVAKGSVSTGNVEVVEFFRYNCPHCYSLEPYVAEWMAHKPDYVQFIRVPTVWNSDADGYARLFYTLKAVGRSDLDREVFDSIQIRGKALFENNASEKTFKARLAFAKAHGVASEAFTKAYYSAQVDEDVRHAQELTTLYRVDSVPKMVVGEEYSADVKSAGDQQKLILLVNDIAASERARRGNGVMPSVTSDGRTVPAPPSRR